AALDHPQGPAGKEPHRSANRLLVLPPGLRHARLAGGDDPANPSDQPMKVIYVLATLWALAYMGCTCAFVAAVDAPMDGCVAVTWLLFGQVVLGALAYEIAALVLFLSCLCLGVSLTHDLVPRSLTQEQLA